MAFKRHTGAMRQIGREKDGDMTVREGRRTMRRRNLMLVASVAMLPATALAQDLPTTRAGLDSAVSARFAEADRNHDGAIDRSEAAAVLGIAASAVARRPKSQALFDLSTGPDGRPQLSLNDDGPLSSGGMFDMLFTQIDRNGDDKLSQTEVQAAARARFDAADINHDGTLSKAELAAARQQLGVLQQALSGEP
jgi:EF hand